MLHLFDLLHPVIAFDSANYHMAAAKIYRETATLSFLDGVRFNAQPHLSVLLYLRHWLLWDEDFAAKLVNLEFELILLLTLVYAAREVRWRDGWILGVLFLAAMPALAGIASVEYAELSVAAFAAAGCAVLFHQVRRAGPPGHSRLWVIAGVLFGLAAAAKHTGAALFACAIVGYVAARVLSRSLKAECFRSVGVLGLAGFLPVSIWWARSWIYTGTPFYPFWQTLHYPEGPAPPYDLGAVYRVDHSLGGIAQTFFGLVRGSKDAFQDPAAFGIALSLLLVVAASAPPGFREHTARRATRARRRSCFGRRGLPAVLERHRAALPIRDSAAVHRGDRVSILSSNDWVSPTTCDRPDNAVDRRDIAQRSRHEFYKQHAVAAAGEPR